MSENSLKAIKRCQCPKKSCFNKWRNTHTIAIQRKRKRKLMKFVKRICSAQIHLSGNFNSQGNKSCRFKSFIFWGINRLWNWRRGNENRNYRGQVQAGYYTMANERQKAQN